jgi:hypothetical protein
MLTLIPDAKKSYLITFAFLSLILISQLLLHFTSVTSLNAQIIEIEEPTDSLAVSSSPVIKVDTEESLPENGTVTVDIVGTEDIDIVGVPPSGMTILVQNDTVTVTDEDVVVSNDIITGVSGDGDGDGDGDG